MQASGQPLDRAIALSEQILDAVQQQQWQQVAAIGQDRASIIQRYYANTQVVDREKTIRLKQINDQIVALLRSARQQTREQQLDMRQGNRASQAYRDIASD